MAELDHNLLSRLDRAEKHLCSVESLLDEMLLLMRGRDLAQAREVLWLLADILDRFVEQRAVERWLRAN